MNDFIQKIQTWITEPFKGKYVYQVRSEFSLDEVKTRLDYRFFEKFIDAICERIADDYLKLHRKEIYKSIDKKVVTKLVLLKIAEKMKKEITQ